MELGRANLIMKIQTAARTRVFTAVLKLFILLLFLGEAHSIVVSLKHRRLALKGNLAPPL